MMCNNEIRKNNVRFVIYELEKPQMPIQNQIKRVLEKSSNHLIQRHILFLLSFVQVNVSETCNERFHSCNKISLDFATTSKVAYPTHIPPEGKLFMHSNFSECQKRQFSIYFSPGRTKDDKKLYFSLRHSCTTSLLACKNSLCQN